MGPLAGPLAGARVGSSCSSSRWRAPTPVAAAAPAEAGRAALARRTRCAVAAPEAPAAPALGAIDAAAPSTSSSVTPAAPESLPFDGQPQQQRQACAAAAAPPAAGGDTQLADAIEAAFDRVFSGPSAAPRVRESWARLRAGDEFVHHWPGLGLQHASSYLPGLPVPPHPFPELASPGYEWLLEVERASDVIISEFERLMANPAALEAAGNSVWVPAARDDAVSYGPDWRTLVLQDRGEWDKFNSKIFSQTRKLLTSINAPTVEVFFARQSPGTGIASHTDYVNFVQTSHLGLRVPSEGECWMKCGDGPPRRWEVGRAICMDTSFMHETWNGGSEDRYVLIMRHWHPGTTPVERVALQFLFDAVDRRGTRYAENKAAKQLRALNLGSSGSGGGAPAAAANAAAPKAKAAAGKAGGAKRKGKK